MTPWIAFRAAIALAVYKAIQKNHLPVFLEGYLKRIVIISTAFKEYIISAHDGTKDA
ncbi:hypothetical protein AOQ84DRAFT_391337 [Glonium stellatum]|uniref:Uncharacterized protein n=1 Tax=Glonium stellatum TaxID=574774 RepID=A0A8E2JPD6_9PEZI|nr:hypothetical protein AOQ84DRAFT_391337 [Glonium stellatum]